MSSYLENHQNFNFRNSLAPFAQDQDLPFAEVLSEADVAQIFAAEKVSFGALARSFWTPALTLWAFLWQVLSADKSCRQVVANVLMSFALSHEPENIDTGLYCRARAKLPPAVFRRLALRVGHRLECLSPEHWLWKGRHVHVVDGSTSRLPDTEENQKEFPQAKTQKKGLGFPLIRWVALIGLATAAVQGFAYGPYAGKETGETALFRQLFDYLQRGAIVLADRYYCSYFMVALLQCRGVDVVARLHQQRKYDFRRGERLGEPATMLQGADYVRVEKVMLKMLRKQKVGHRPGRCEPRAVKVRPKPHKLLTEPRQEARAKLLQGKPAKQE